MAQLGTGAQRLERAVASVRKRWGTQSLQRGLQITPGVLSTGFRRVDRLLGTGGLPRGKVIELIGHGTGGQLTLAAKTIGQAQRIGQDVAYVDVDQTIDLDLLVHLGVGLDALVVLRPHSFCHALEMTRDILREGETITILFDRIHPLPSSRNASGQLNRLLRESNTLLNRSLSTLIFLTELDSPQACPPDLAVHDFASVRLSFRHRRWLYRRHLVSGFVSEVTVLRNRLGPSGQSALIEVSWTTQAMLA